METDLYRTVIMETDFGQLIQISEIRMNYLDVKTNVKYYY